MHQHYLKLLVDLYLREEKNQDGPLHQAARDPNLRNIVLSVIKMHSLNPGKRETLSPKIIAEKSTAVATTFKNKSLFSQICSQTLLQHRKHEDMLRYMDFIFRQKEDENKWNKRRDARRSTTVDDRTVSGKQLLEIAAKSSEELLLFEKSVSLKSLKDIKTKVSKFNCEFSKVTWFVSQYYDDMPENRPDLDELFNLKKELTVIGSEIRYASGHNPKSQVLIDCFLHLSHALLLKEQPSRRAVNQAIMVINNNMGCDKGTSPENLATMKSNARDEIKTKTSLSMLQKQIASLT